MIFREINEFATALQLGRLIGIDLGTKRLGLAISDETRLIATAKIVINRKSFAVDIAAIMSIYREQQAVGVVFGLPIAFNCSETLMSQEVLRFAQKFERSQNLIPISFFDERLSTSVVNRFLIDEMDMSRQKRHKVVDKMAAAYILQNMLDRLKNLSYANHTL